MTRDELYRYPNSYFVQLYECDLGTVSYAVSQDYENFVGMSRQRMIFYAVGMLVA